MLPMHLLKYAEKQPVLGGQGFVRVVDVMGDDGSIVEAARVTTGKGRSQHEWVGVPNATNGRMSCKVCKQGRVWVPEYAEWATDAVCIEGDRRMLNYMMAHNHASPFDFAEFVVHIRCPIMVFRQWVRHWSWEFQEYSGRYSPMIDEMLTTNPEEWRKQSTANRQGSGGLVADWPENYQVERGPFGVDVLAPDGMGFHVPGNGGAIPGDYLSAREQQLHVLAREVYAERQVFGVANEQARKDLPISNMTEVYCKASLRDLLHFLYLRTDSHAQQEIRVYADVIAGFVEQWVPLTWGAFVEHRRDAVTFSASAVRALRAFIDAGHVWGNDADLETELSAAGVGPRERGDVLAKLGIK